MKIFDIETDGLLDVLTKIHVLSYRREDGVIVSTHDYDEMRDFFLNAEVLVGHDIIRFDIPAVEKVLGIKVKARLWDTLPMAWYINHKRMSHGLAVYGEEFGVPKPKIDDWENLSPEEYAHRCEEDVKINTLLWDSLMKPLRVLYPEESERGRFLDYLAFKMYCAREQSALQWKLDKDLCQSHFDRLSEMRDLKKEQLRKAMPKKPIMKDVNRPKNFYNKDGSISKRGEAFEAKRKEHKQPPTVQTFRIVASYEDGNPDSPAQVKEWLYSLGWEPRTWKYVRDKNTGDERKIEQITKDGELCESVRELSDKDPAVEMMDGYKVLGHRIGILKSFLTNVTEDGYLTAEIAGLTNTLRFKHASPLVNLPGVDKPYGEEIRGVLIAPEGHTLAGADMTSLEDTTKRHYMKPLDPEYVEEMSKEGFDPHLDLAKFAGEVTQSQIDDYNQGLLPSLSRIRKSFKVVNYSATYGVGVPTLARNSKMSRPKAAKLLEAFWKRNWAIKKISENLMTKDVNGGTWLKNPVSGFWYSLRSNKDRFSTLNQGTGVYCFDLWVGFCRGAGLQVIGQFHDEIIALVKVGEEQKVEAVMEEAITSLNETLKLNVPLGTDLKFGENYAEIH